MPNPVHKGIFFKKDQSLCIFVIFLSGTQEPWSLPSCHSSLVKGSPTLPFRGEFLITSSLCKHFCQFLRTFLIYPELCNQSVRQEERKGFVIFTLWVRKIRLERLWLAQGQTACRWLRRNLILGHMTQGSVGRTLTWESGHLFNVSDLQVTLLQPMVTTCQQESRKLGSPGGSLGSLILSADGKYGYPFFPPNAPQYYSSYGN